MSNVIPFPARPKPRVVPIRTGHDFEQEYREAWERAFKNRRGQSDIDDMRSSLGERPCDQEPQT